MPVIVFWLVDRKFTQFPASASDENVVLIGGLASNTFELVAKAIPTDPVTPPTPLEVALSIIGGERYKPVFKH